MKKISAPFTFAASWQFVSSAVIILACIGLLLMTQLNVLLPGYSSSEKQFVDTTSTPAAILDDASFLPHKALSFSIRFATHDNYLSARLATVFIAGAAVILFYLACNRWYSKRTAFLATVLFATSAWFLHIGRVATPDVMYVASILALGLFSNIFKNSSKPFLWSLVLIFVVGASLFTPGIVWIILLGAVLGRSYIQSFVRSLSKKKLAILIGTIITALTPLAYTIYRSPDILRALIGLPANMPDVVAFLKQLAYVPLSVVGRTPGNPEWHLGHLPYLDIITIVLFALGLYYYVKFRRSLSAIMLTASLVIIIIIVALSATQIHAMLLPFIYFIAAAGISVLTNQWLTVFPRNPVAKSVGIGLVSIIVAASCVYNLRNYFVAWPNTPAAKGAYHHKL